MKYLETEANLGGAECSEDAKPSTQVLHAKLGEITDQLNALPADAPINERITLQLQQCYHQLDLHDNDAAWETGHVVFKSCIDNQIWLHAAEACDVLFKAEKDDAIKALGHGIWLGVTYPIDPDLSVALLQHFIDETPDNSDGAAVAAATASYIVDMRATGEDKDQLSFFTTQLLGQVARRHSQVDEQDVFDFWVDQLQLNDPATFLPRLSEVLNVIVGDDWWFDRDALRAQLPD